MRYTVLRFFVYIALVSLSTLSAAQVKGADKKINIAAVFKPIKGGPSAIKGIEEAIKAKNNYLLKKYHVELILKKRVEN